MGLRLHFLRAGAAVAVGTLVSVAPVVTPPAASARPVPPQMHTLSVDGVHTSSLNSLPEAGPAHDADDEPASKDDVVALTSPRTTEDFSALGVTWDADGPSPESVSVRVRTEGAWGDWVPLELDDDHGPDPGSGESRRAGSAPLVTGSSDGVQVRVDSENGAPEEIQVDLVDPGTSPADSGLTTPPASAHAAATRPTIHDRSAWGADESIRKGHSYGTVRVGYVHHTATASDYTAAEVPAILRSIYAYHVLSRGWNDIGYNFIVDRFGRVWEGRYGGVDRAVVGAHTAGYNSSSFAASALGDFTTVAPPAAMTDAITALFAWKLGVHHVDPQGSATLVSGSTAKTFAAISGHRDAASTACPGELLYAQLPALRRAVASRQGTEIHGPTLTTSSSWPFGGGGATVRASATTAGTWRLNVVGTCDGGLTATSSGSVDSGSFTAAWNGRVGGVSAPPGEYRLTLSFSGTAGGASTPWSTTVRVIAAQDSAADPCVVRRLAGANRYATAVEVARAANSTSKVVVLASGEARSMGDALVAGPLTGAKSAALLLTRAGELPNETVEEIVRRGAHTAYLVGGEAAVSPSVATQLADQGVRTIVRLGGKDRYATAARVAAEVGGSGEAVIANGLDASFSDGLVASGPATALGLPILLVRADEIPRETSDALESLAIQRTAVAGGSAVVTDAVLRQLPSPVRLGGANRFESSIAVARWASARLPNRHVTVASGAQDSLVDALAGGQLGQVTVYVSRDSMRPEVRNWLTSTPTVERATVLGGVSVVSAAVAVEVQGAISR